MQEEITLLVWIDGKFICRINDLDMALVELERIRKMKQEAVL